MFDPKKTLKSLENTLHELLAQMDKEEKPLKARIKKEMPEFLNEYEALMAEVWRGEKGAAEIAAWWSKYEHVLKTKSAKTDLNTK